MFCQQCGHELPAGATSCSACGAAVFYPPPPPPPGRSSPSADPLISDVRRSARELAGATARLSKRIAAKAEVAAKDPSGSARKVARKVSKELDLLAKEIDRVLKDL